MIGNFNEEAQTVLMNAKKEMLDLGHPYIGTEHLLIGIMREGDSIAVRIMLDLGVNPQKLYNEIIKYDADVVIDGYIQ